MEEAQTGSIIILLSSILIGLAFGFVLQRGRYCMNSAFRDIVFINDFTIFRAYLLALFIAIIGANLLEDLGFMGDGLRRQAFAPVANIFGGYIFGLGIVMAGGCGSGIIYRIGEGVVAALFAAIGFAVGIVTTTKGVLKPLYGFLRSFKVEIGGEPAPALWNLFGSNGAIKWTVIAIVAAALIFFVLKGKPFAKNTSKGFSWSFTGLLIGLILILAWWASVYWGGQARALSFTGPTSDFFLAVMLADSSAASDPVFDFWGIFKSTWAAFYVIGVPAGAYISAKLLKEFRLKAPGAGELLYTFAGGLVMGFGAATAGGCTVGHALTGVSTLSVASIVTTIFIILGNWTMVYFKFIKPMKE